MNTGALATARPASLPDVRAFETGAIDPAGFNHEAHVHVAWCYLREFPLAEAIARFTAALRALTMKLDAATKYHETISWFFMIEIADRRADAPDDDWDTFRRRNPDLMTDAAGILHRHYSPTRLHSAKARRLFLLPDRAAAG